MLIPGNILVPVGRAPRFTCGQEGDYWDALGVRVFIRGSRDVPFGCFSLSENFPSCPVSALQSIGCKPKSGSGTADNTTDAKYLIVLCIC
jgi:hypothetical protein